MIRISHLALAIFVLHCSFEGSTSVARAAEPDYAAWTQILQKNYDPARGMDYKSLKAKDGAAFRKLRQDMSRVNAAGLAPKEQLAYWLNLYNISTVATIIDHYPVESIRDISTDPIIRLNVFKKKTIPLGKTKVSLDWIENEKIRNGFKDPRIHFAINCAANSCPPMSPEAFTGARVDAQLDESARKFFNGPMGARIVRKGDKTRIHASKVLDWFSKDFQTWGGGTVVFIRRYLSPERQKQLDAARGEVELEYDDYDWALNDWKR